jgi:hypothetical protein
MSGPDVPEVGFLIDGGLGVPVKVNTAEAAVATFPEVWRA